MQPLTVDCHIETRGGKTVLRLVHSGFGATADWDDEYDAVKRGWGFELIALRHYLSRHRGQTRVTAWPKAPVDGLADDEVWKRLLGPKGLGFNGHRLEPGDRFNVRAATGDQLSGVILTKNPPREIGMALEQFNHALFRFDLIHLGPVRTATLWLEAWGVPESEVRAFGERWEKQLRAIAA